MKGNCNLKSFSKLNICLMYFISKKSFRLIFNISLIITLQILLNSNAYSQDLEYPQIVDGGDINIAFDSLGMNITVTKTTSFKVKNISGEPIYFFGTTEKSITPIKFLNGIQNRISSFDIASQYYLDDNDSINMDVNFNIYFLDDYSANNEKLKFKGWIYYRKFNTKHYDSVSLEFHFKAVDKKEIFIMNFDKQDISYDKKFFGVNTPYYQSIIARIYNSSEDTVSLDSINLGVIGNNKVKYFFGKSEDTIKYTLPYVIPPNHSLYLRDSIKYTQPENTIINYKIVGHKIKNNESVTLEDSSVIRTKMWDKLRIRSDINNLMYLKSKVGDSLYLKNIKTFNYTDTTWYLKDFKYSCEYPEDVRFFLDSLPIQINKQNEYGAYYIEYARGGFYPKHEGRYNIFCELFYESEFGDKMKHTILYVVNVDKSTDIEENSDKDKINVYPNPATDFITIILQPSEGLKPSEGSEVEIYNSFGELVLADVQHLGDVGHLLRIDVSHLPVGLYFVKIGNRIEKLVKM